MISSDLDYRMSVAGIPQAELDARELEQMQEERWRQFVADLKPFGWATSTLLHSLSRAHALAQTSHLPGWQAPEEGSITEVILNFKDGQEWSAVLAALSLVLVEAEQERERLLTQG